MPGFELRRDDRRRYKKRKLPENILAMDCRTGRIAVFKSVIDASEKLNLNPKTIYMAIKRGSQVAGRFCFDYFIGAEHRDGLFDSEINTEKRIGELERKVVDLERALSRLAEGWR